METRGVVININYLGAVVRLADGTLAAVPPAEATTHQALLAESLREHRELPFVLSRRGKHPAAFLSRQAVRETPAPAPAPLLEDPVFEDRMAAYLRSYEQNEPPAALEAAERRLFEKKKRAQLFSVKKHPDARL